jgi:hypothetical protein
MPVLIFIVNSCNVSVLYTKFFSVKIDLMEATWSNKTNYWWNYKLSNYEKLRSNIIRMRDLCLFKKNLFSILGFFKQKKDDK